MNIWKSYRKFWDNKKAPEPNFIYSNPLPEKITAKQQILDDMADMVLDHQMKNYYNAFDAGSSVQTGPYISSVTSNAIYIPGNIYPVAGIETVEKVIPAVIPEYKAVVEWDEIVSKPK